MLQHCTSNIIVTSTPTPRGERSHNQRVRRIAQEELTRELFKAAKYRHGPFAKCWKPAPTDMKYFLVISLWYYTTLNTPCLPPQLGAKEYFRRGRSWALRTRQWFHQTADPFRTVPNPDLHSNSLNDMSERRHFCRANGTCQVYREVGKAKNMSPHRILCPS